MTTLNSVLNRNQKVTFEKKIAKNRLLTVTVRFDDECGNGRNRLSVTGEVTTLSKKTMFECGCIHDTIAKHFPELKEAIAYHLCSTNKPMNYISNTIFWAEEGNRTYARSAAIAPDAGFSELLDKKWLEARLPSLLNNLKNIVTGLGMVY